MSKPKKLRDNRMEADRDERVLPVNCADYGAMGQDVDEVIADAIADRQLAEKIAEKHGIDVHHIVPRRYVPPQCTMCTALRGDDTNDYTRVVSTQRETGLIVRYCKCGFCGNTFKALERI